MDRELRQVPTQVDFDRRVFPSLPPPATLPTIRLADTSYASQFNPKSQERLSPISGDFPCAYIGQTKFTTVLEVYSDKFHTTRKTGGTVHSITRVQAAKQKFMTATLPSLNLCDLTHGDHLAAAGLDVSTLMCTDFTLTRTWAERIARHPAKFDGLHYRSRHTNDPCLVLWVRPGGRALEKEVTLTAVEDFLLSPEAHMAAAKCELKLAFV